MATSGWSANTAVSDRIRLPASKYNYNQLIKLLLSDVNNGKDLCDQLDDAFYFQSDIRYSQPDTRVSSYRPFTDRKADSQPRLLFSQFGITAYNGPLPEPYQEWIFRELNDGYRTRQRSALLDFIDIFNHRFLAIQHQNRAEQRISLQTPPPNESSVAKRIECFAGFFEDRNYDSVNLAASANSIGNTQQTQSTVQHDETESVQQKRLEKRVVQAFSGLIVNPRKTAGFIQSLVGVVFNCKVSVQQFSGHWLALSQSDVSVLGGQNAELGSQAIIGAKTWDQQSLIDLNIGPLDYEPLCRMQKGGQWHDTLKGIIQYASDGQWDCRVTLNANWASLPQSKLSSCTGQKTERFALGRNSWLKSRLKQSSLVKSQFQADDSSPSITEYSEQLGITSVLRYPMIPVARSQFMVRV